MLAHIRGALRPFQRAPVRARTIAPALAMGIGLASATGAAIGAQEHEGTAHLHAPAATPAGQPRSAPMDGVMFQGGAWSLMLHGWAAGTHSRGDGPRGVTGSYSTSMVMLTAARPLANGVLTVRTMGSAEPTMPRAGYPLLLQTGETADGVVPLRDRQHPHDLISELAVEYRRDVGEGLVAFGYAAPVGAPALGPVPFFHRASGNVLPEAPLGHHLHDATHITHGVLTVGVVANDRLTLEGSLFNGREPDQHRWDIDRLALDSYAFRASLALGADWAVQGSMARVSQPERTHPLIDQSRLSASVTHNRPLARGNWQTTVAYGRALTMRKVIRLSEARRRFSAPVLAHYLDIAPPQDVPEDSLSLLFPGREKGGWLVESQLRHGRATIATRVERLAKDELFDPSDLRHSQIFTVTKGSIGVQLQLLSWRALSVAAGGVANAHVLPAALREAYGDHPSSRQLYTRVVLGAAR